MNDHDAHKEVPWRLTAGSDPGVIAFSGEIDFSVTPAVRERLWELVGKAGKHIELDLADLTYIDSSGLALLLELRKQLAEADRTVAIRSISPQVRKLFNLTQLSDLFGLPD
ncbi:anti-sigma-factor antagonist [Solidesulfovibrio fructosivorans JJ]]|uniref:Anti-sigma factor antagonist n=1 Tax=Solidesulfovibrio fructosivorans JJ] TaxID=596151 RepID=E1JVC7_SOLFR|nr:STAS domain-containing protein [Solidesulfovibrio fructosivorans]EFL51721.1 anti-sigma-factor antagonist [Solidesulfovibrio fructosivorans JJ]]